MKPVVFTGAIHEVRLKRNRVVGVAGLRRREGWEKVVVGYVTRGGGGVLGGVKVKVLRSVMVADSPLSKQMVAVFL